MEALKIIESYTEELTEKGIVICSFLLEDDPTIVVNCIDISHYTEYPQFEIVRVIDEIEENIFGELKLSGSTEGYVGS